MGIPKFPKLGLPRLWGPITLCVDLRLKWSLKQSCSPHWDLSNSMSHITCTQGNQVDSQLLVVGNQLFFCHNLCFKCPNKSCEAILNIYVSINFQWYKELFIPMSFDPCNCPLKIWESIGIPIPKMGVHLGVWGFIPSHSFALLGTWDVIPGLPSWSEPRKPLLWSRAQG